MDPFAEHHARFAPLPLWERVASTEPYEVRAG